MDFTTRSLLTRALICNYLVLSTFAFQATNDEILLQGRLTDTAGAALPGARVSLRNTDGSLVESLFTSDYGTFSLRLRPGIFDLQFRLDGMIETWLKDLDLRKQPTRALHIAMPVLGGGDPRVTDAERAAAPPLETTFLPNPSLIVGQPLRGRVIVHNKGVEPVELPTQLAPTDVQRDSKLRMMAVSLFMPASKARYFRYYTCRPHKDCLQLMPGALAGLDVTLLEPEAGPSNERRPMIIREPGILSIDISLTFVLQGEEARMTESIKATAEIVAER